MRQGGDLAKQQAGPPGRRPIEVKGRRGWRLGPDACAYRRDRSAPGGVADEVDEEPDGGDDKDDLDEGGEERIEAIAARGSLDGEVDRVVRGVERERRIVVGEREGKADTRVFQRRTPATKANMRGGYSPVTATTSCATKATAS